MSPSRGASLIAWRASANDEVLERRCAEDFMNACSLWDREPKLAMSAHRRPEGRPVVHSVCRNASSYSEYTPEVSVLVKGFTQPSGGIRG
jgi:hypothetical protein